MVIVRVEASLVTSTIVSRTQLVLACGTVYWAAVLASIVTLLSVVLVFAAGCASTGSSIASSVVVASAVVVISIVSAVVISARCGRWDVRGRGGGGHRVRVNTILELVYAYVIDVKVRGRPGTGLSLCEGVGITTKESTTNSKVDDEEKVLVEWCSIVVIHGSIRARRQLHGVEVDSVDEKLDGFGCPLAGIYVEILGEVLVGIAGTRSFILVVGPSSSEVKSGTMLSVLSTAVLHNVDLSRSCP